MPESFGGGENGGRLEEDMSFAEMVEKLAMLTETEKAEVVYRLSFAIRIFIKRILIPFNEKLSIKLYNDVGAFFPAIEVEPDIGATEIVDDVLHLRGLTAELRNSINEDENRRLSARILNFLQEAGYDVSGHWGQSFDLRISLSEFERIVRDI